MGIGEVLLWLLGIVVTVTLSILLTDPVNYVLAKVLGGRIKTKKGLGGIWRATNKIVSQGKDREAFRYFKVRQFGNHVVAISLTKSYGSYEVKGKIDSRKYFVGSWHEVTSDGREYNGTMLLALAPTGTKLNGKYLSYNRQSEIISGDWEWKLETRDASKKVVESYTLKNPATESVT